MNFEIRRLTPEDVPAHLDLMSLAFEQGQILKAEEEAAEYVAHRWGLFEGGKLRSSLGIRPFEVHWGGETTLSMGGIAEVASSPEARGAGYVNALLRHALQTMKDNGQVISALYPFNREFYHRFGWETVGDQRKMTIPLRLLPKFAESRGLAERIDGGVDRKDKLADAYTRFGRCYRGMFTVDSHKWAALKPFDNRKSCVHHYPPTGEYMIWRYGTDSNAGHINVRSWVAWTPEGYRALLSILHHLANQSETGEVVVPADTLLPHVMGRVVSTYVQPVFMGRVVDVAKALARLPAPEGISGSIPIHLRDECAPWNTGTWRIIAEGGAVSCERVADLAAGDALVEMDIQAFSQAFWGTPSLAVLRAAGRVIVREEMAFELLHTLLPSAPVFTMDTF